MFPISSIGSIRTYVKAWDDELLRKNDLSDRNSKPTEAVQLFAGGEWNTGVVFQAIGLSRFASSRRYPHHSKDRRNAGTPAELVAV